MSWQYGEIYRDLRERGELIGSNDLWDRCDSSCAQIPLVTGNLDEFRRVPDFKDASI